MVYLSESDLTNLDKWIYKVKGVTIMDPYLRKWYNLAFRLVPLTSSPDTLTVLGFISGLICVALTIFFSPTLTEEAPRWVYAFCGFGLFFYHTMDALDGKQCRRAGRNSGVEELYDHGCDAVNSTFQFIITSNCMRLGNDVQLWLIVLFLGNFTFFCVHWRTYVTGVHRVDKLDHNETSYVGIFVLFMTSACGTQLWDIQVSQFNVSLRHIAGIVMIASGALKVFSDMKDAIILGKSVIPGSTMLVGYVCFTLCSRAMLGWIEARGMLVVFGLFVGLFAAKQNQRMVVSHLVDRKNDFLDSSLVPVFLLTTAVLFSEISSNQLTILVAGCCVFAGLDVAHFFISVTLEMAKHYQFDIFTMRQDEKIYLLEEDVPDPCNKLARFPNGGVAKSE